LLVYLKTVGSQQRAVSV